MNPRVAKRTFGVGLAALFLAAGCERNRSGVLQGYIEGEYVYVGSPVAGVLEKRPVDRGDTVSAGDELFVLESEAERASVAEAEKHLAQAEARLDDLQKGLRPTELAALEARVEQARATADLWNAEWARRQRLHREDVISEAELDQVRGQQEAAAAELERAKAELATGRLGGREDEIRAAEADREAAAAAVARARWALDNKRQCAEAGGLIHDTLYRPGEFVPLGAPVVALLPPGNIRVRFFAPEGRLTALSAGTTVEVYRDGSTNATLARISYIATKPEFTPPVIFSRETRAKLVYMIEARFPPEVATQFHPGQPVDVRLPLHGG